MFRYLMMSIAALVACGEVMSPPPPPQPQATSTPVVLELTSAGGNLRSKTYTLDVQLGHASSQNKVAGPTHSVDGNAAVKP